MAEESYIADADSAIPFDRQSIEMSRAAVSPTPVKHSWEIQYSELEIGQELGKGGFGVVYCGKWRNGEVAGTTQPCISDESVKQIIQENITPEMVEQFKAEAELLR